SLPQAQHDRRACGWLRDRGPRDSAPDCFELERGDRGLERRRLLTCHAGRALVQIIQQRGEHRIRKGEYALLREVGDVLVRELGILRGLGYVGVHGDLRWLNVRPLSRTVNPGAAGEDEKPRRRDSGIECDLRVPCSRTCEFVSAL